MKLSVNHNQNWLDLTIDAATDHPIFYLADEDLVSASINLDDYNLPSRPVILKDRNRITQQMIDDFEAFIDNVEDLCELNYGLISVYKNVSNDHSYYYNYLAKGTNGNIVLKLRLRLRISNHDAHSTKEQKRNKKLELQSEKLRSLLTDGEIRKLTSYAKYITINDDAFDSYEDASVAIDEMLEHAVKVMTK